MSIVKKSNARPVWCYHEDQHLQNNAPTYGRAKAFLYDKLYSSITQHDLLECYKLLRLVPRETSLDPYVVFRFILILINSVDTNSVNKNFIIYLESLLARFTISVPDAFVEFVTYFVRNNRIEDAKELFNLRHRFVTHLNHRRVPYVDLNLCCYKFFISFHDWDKRCQNQEARFDYSTQGWLVNAMDSLKQVTGNYEYFAVGVVKVLLYFGFKKKAYLFTSEYHRMNPDNLAAQLLFLNLINLLLETQDDIKQEHKEVMEQSSNSEQSRFESRLEEISTINNFNSNADNELFNVAAHPITTDKQSILDNLVRLDQTRNEIFELVGDDPIELVKSMMDSLEHIEEVNNLARWRTLSDELQFILASNDEELTTRLRNLWQTRYQQYWHLDFFLNFGGKETPGKDLIGNVLQLLSSKFDGSDDLAEIEDEDVIIVDMD